LGNSLYKQRDCRSLRRSVGQAPGHDQPVVPGLTVRIRNADEVPDAKRGGQFWGDVPTQAHEHGVVVDVAVLGEDEDLPVVACSKLEVQLRPPLPEDRAAEDVLVTVEVLGRLLVVEEGDVQPGGRKAY